MTANSIAILSFSDIAGSGILVVHDLTTDANGNNVRRSFHGLSTAIVFFSIPTVLAADKDFVPQPAWIFARIIGCSNDH